MWVHSTLSFTLKHRKKLHPNAEKCTINETKSSARNARRKQQTSLLKCLFSIGLNVNMNILCWILPFALLEWLYLDDVCKITLFTTTFEISPPVCMCMCDCTKKKTQITMHIHLLTNVELNITFPLRLVLVSCVDYVRKFSNCWLWSWNFVQLKTFFFCCSLTGDHP